MKFYRANYLRSAMLFYIFFCMISDFIAAEGPCDIFGRTNTHCVAAHSTVRALYGNYKGPLYQVKRQIDNATLDISVLSSGGLANSSAQDSFCRNSNCVIQIIYDQSPMANHLKPAPGGGWNHNPDIPVDAKHHKITVGGLPVYGAYFESGMGYRNDQTKGVATGNDPETLYMVTSGTHYNGACCFDYGNAEVNNNAGPPGTMECIYFGNCNWWSTGQGAGPWVMADLEAGLWAGNAKKNDKNLPINTEYVTAMLKGGTNSFALKGNDATKGTLQVMYNGPRPNGYQPMKKQGAIVLGIGVTIVILQLVPFMRVSLLLASQLMLPMMKYKPTLLLQVMASNWS